MAGRDGDDQRLSVAGSAGGRCETDPRDRTRARGHRGDALARAVSFHLGKGLKPCAGTPVDVTADAVNDAALPKQLALGRLIGERTPLVFEQKAALLAVYAVLLLAACILPFALQLRTSKSPSAWIIDRVYAVLLALGGLALLAARPRPGLTSPVVLSIAFAAPLILSGAGYAIGGLLALPLIAAATWWDPNLRLDATRAIIFLLVGLLAAALPRLLPRTEGAPSLLPSLLALFLLGIAAVSLTGVMRSPQGFGTVWHHWSVYVGAAEAFLGGAIPFQDYPVQYGMGPTLLVAGLCRGECWTRDIHRRSRDQPPLPPGDGGCVVLLPGNCRWASRSSRSPPWAARS